MVGGHTSRDSLVWYASYGANMSYERLSAYIRGGRPPGGVRVNPGCRDRTMPRDDRALVLDGDVYFALASPMWGGGLGAGLDLDTARRTGRLRLGDGRYDTTCHLGDHEDGRPVFTFTAGWIRDDVPLTAPSAGYLRAIATGLLEGFDWSVDDVVAYLAGRPGAAGHWSARDLAALLDR